MDVEFEFKEKNGGACVTKAFGTRRRLAWYRKVWADFR